MINAWNTALEIKIDQIIEELGITEGQDAYDTIMDAMVEKLVNDPAELRKLLEKQMPPERFRILFRGWVGEQIQNAERK